MDLPNPPKNDLKFQNKWVEGDVTEINEKRKQRFENLGAMLDNVIQKLKSEPRRWMN